VLAQAGAFGPAVRDLLVGALLGALLFDGARGSTQPLEESIMIPPSFLTGSFLFTLIPVWEQEPAAPAPCPAPPPDDGAAPEQAAAPSESASGADADGVNDQVALRMVFKGYKLGVTTDWVAEVNPGHVRWGENRSDDDADRQRQDQRARSAARPALPQAPGAPDSTASAPSPDDSE
jgi:hypothetical protein